VSRFHIAQINIARMVAPLESETMSGFVARLDEINALADGSPFTFRTIQPPDESFLDSFDWSVFQPCPAI